MSQMDFDDTLFNQALSFLRAGIASHRLPGRRSLLQRCAEHLRQHHDISVICAEDVTIRAYGEVASAGVREYVDLSRTTSHVITLRDPGTGMMRMLTVADLLRLIGPARHAPPRLVTTH